MPDIDTRFYMVKETGLYDYIDKTPASNEVEQVLLASKNIIFRFAVEVGFIC